MAQTPHNVKRTLGIFALFYLIIVGGPTVYRASQSRSGKDYASYHYAAHAVWSKTSPYHGSNLDVHARRERTRRKVHPFFYPPPAVLFFLWSPLFSLKTSFVIFSVMGNVCWLASLWLIRKMIGASWILLGVVGVLYSPASGSVNMGQVNLLVLFLLLLAYHRSNGLLISLPAMIKMSPAVVVFQWLGAQHWTRVLWSGLGAVALSLLTLLAVDWSEQVRFYTEIFPRFSAGPYHGLTVPITLPANHSIADIWNQIWPGPLRVSGQAGFSGTTGVYQLSETGRFANSISTAALFVILCVASFFRRKPSAQLALFGFSCVVMTVTPLYAYEHHLIFVAFPLILCLHSLHRKLISWKWGGLLIPAAISLAIPLEALRWVKRHMPDEMGWYFKESKFFALLALGVCCLYLCLKGIKVLQGPSEGFAHRQGSSIPE